MKEILVTGGLGYIGSHTCIKLLQEGYDVIIIDNLSNSKIKVKNIIEDLTNKKIKFYNGDIRDKELLTKIFSENNIYCVIHFAGLKAVGESVEIPMKYYNNNVIGSLSLFEIMDKFDCRNVIFSSSASLYGKAKTMPINEECPLAAINPYSRTKLFIEEILKDLYNSNNNWNIVLLRYFNPVGAHKSGKLGEDPNGIPNNLVPYVTQVAIGKRDYVNVFGNDYDTKDGTGVRDYIHVLDLADGHIKAINKFNESCKVRTYNLGTGVGYSVLDIINAFEEVSGINIKYKITERRKGDADASYADSSKAKIELNWEAKYSLKEMCNDSWRWQKNNPNGFEE